MPAQVTSCKIPIKLHPSQYFPVYHKLFFLFLMNVRLCGKKQAIPDLKIHFHPREEMGNTYHTQFMDYTLIIIGTISQYKTITHDKTIYFSVNPQYLGENMNS